MLRIGCIIAGALVAWFGAALARQEGDLAWARFAARDGRPGSLKAKGADLERAHLAFANAPASREDIAETELDLAVALNRSGFPGGFLAAAEREERIRAAAQRLARASPITANAWCTLALVEAKALERSQSAVEGFLSACYRLGPRDISVVETRLHVALGLWGVLPKAIRLAALEDVAAGLSGEYRDWMLDRLAYGVAVVAPAREELITSFVAPYGDDVHKRYAALLASYRKQFARASGFRPER
jgi:hypothetical protein